LVGGEAEWVSHRLLLLLELTGRVL
jgi:hypothetical protein